MQSVKLIQVQRLSPQDISWLNGLEASSRTLCWCNFVLERIMRALAKLADFQLLCLGF